jgi:predicted RNA-binding Zn-ribbon protein involved in translation (DUF1610 family)
MTHLNQDRFKAMLTKLDDRKICTSAPKDVNLLQHAPQHQSPECSQRQTRSMTQRYESQDANAEDCHIKNACKKRPYSARTPPEPPSATQDSEIQNTTQRKSQKLAERQQTLAPQANEQPPKPKGKKRQRPSEYKLHSNDISYCAVQPLDPKNRATSLWDYKKVCVAGTFNDPSDAFNCMYQYHLQAAEVVDHRLHVNNKRRADETEAEDQEQPLIIEKWALRLLKADKKQNHHQHGAYCPHRCGRCRLRDLL